MVDRPDLHGHRRSLSRRSPRPKPVIERTMEPPLCERRTEYATETAGVNAAQPGNRPRRDGGPAIQDGLQCGSTWAVAPRRVRAGGSRVREEADPETPQLLGGESV